MYMKFSDYQKWISQRWTRGGESPHAKLLRLTDFDCKPTYPREVFIAALGLAGETGEAVEHVKKAIRDGRLDSLELLHELGDILHYLTVLVEMTGSKLETVAMLNIRKLEKRDAAKR